MADFQSLSEKDQALVAVAVSRMGEDSLKILQHLPENRSREIQGILEALLAKPQQQRDALIHEVLAELSGKGKTSLLAHAHASWISEAFKGEGPRVISLILQEVPKARAGGILKDLPKETRRALKKISQAPAPAPIQGLLKKKFGSRFPSIRLASLDKDEVLKKLSEVSLSRFNKILHELGIKEMALAFGNIKSSSIRAILNRLKMDDAKELRNRIRKNPSVNSRDQREAQLHILSLDFEKIDPNEIVQEIGFGVLSKAFGPDDQEASLYFIYKFPPRQGYVFKRYVDQNLSKNSESKIKKVREQILDAYTRIH